MPRTKLTAAEIRILNKALKAITGLYDYGHIPTSKYPLKNDKSRNSTLTDMEIRTLKLMCEEFTYAEIADKLGISSRTVDGYRDSLLLKTNSRGRVGLVKYAIKHNIYILK